MDTMLQNGDFVRGRGGLPRVINGSEEWIQRAMIRLTVRKGSFPLDPKLGSELHLLRDAKRPYWEEQALLYAKEALADMPQAQVLDVKADYSYEKQAIVLTYHLAFREETETAVIEVA